MDIVHDINISNNFKRYKEKSIFSKLIHKIAYKYMGQHTWFYKDKDIFNKVDLLYSKLDEHENGLIYLTDNEVNNIWKEIDELEDFNKAEFHNCFRTSKRNIDNSHIELVLYSKEECYSWINENKEYIYKLNEQYLNEFWEKYPNGVIDFG